MGFGHTDTHQHVVLVVQKHDGTIEPRYSRHPRDVDEEDVWEYHVEAVDLAYDAPAILKAIIFDDGHEHPQAISDGTWHPTDATLHMP